MTNYGECYKTKVQLPGVSLIAASNLDWEVKEVLSAEESCNLRQRISQEC